MRILYLAAGTGSYYCGTCMRDNAVVNRLRQEGHDIHLMPLYLPFSLDESEATDCPLFFGGINSYLQQKVGLFRKTPRFLDAMLDWKPLLKVSAQMADMTKANEHGDMTISMLKGSDGHQAKEMKRMLAWVKDNLKVDIVVISNLMLVGAGVALREELKVPLVASMQGEDSYLDSLPGDQSEEAWTVLRQQVQKVDLLIGVSKFFTAYMAERLQVPDVKMRIVENGIETDGYEVPATRPNPPELGFFAHVTPSKGLHVVVDAFIDIATEEPFANWRLAIGGSCTKADEKYLNEQKAKLQAAGLADRVRYANNLTKDEKQAFYKSVSVLAVVPNYQEAFGLYVVESILSGTPLLLPDRGALPELMESTGAGAIFATGDTPADDAKALAEALRQQVSSPEKLEAFQAQAVAGREVVLQRYSVGSMAEAFKGVLEEACAAANA